MATLAAGTRLGPYEILEPIGAGGMGEVHRARHLRLQRDVAVKVLPTSFASDPRHLARFEREARSASALNHPNIVSIYDIAEHDGVTYIAMELVHGSTLLEIIQSGPISIAEAGRLGIQVASGLARAHGAGIVHRDLKPANVMVTTDGLVKILDFGLAKPAVSGPTIAGSASTAHTREGMVVGTPQYMSPEQASGEHVDFRSDQFAFGAVLYELLTGRAAFDGPSLGAVVSAVVAKDPPSVRQLRPDVPVALARIVERCLAKSAAHRFESTDALVEALTRASATSTNLATMLRRPRVAVPLGVVALAALTAAVAWTSGAERRWAETVAPREISELVEAGDVYPAYRLASEALRHRPDDPVLRKLLERVTLPARIATDPAGAEIWVKRYGVAEEDWRRIGTTPFETRIPYAMMQWRLVKAGFEPFEGAPFSGPSLAALARGIPLDTLGGRPADMVRVPSGPVTGASIAVRPRSMSLDSYLLDRFEVTNEQFQRFVDAGGYSRPELWLAGQRDEDTTFNAAATFVDHTGRPGPATWELGRFPADEPDHPVSGVSWFEAAAYCEWAEKRLPTMYHWFSAIGQDQLSDILRFSNFLGRGKSAVGAYPGMTAFGNYDLGGNVREWVHNRTQDKRFLLGAAWNEPGLFRAANADDPWSRAPTNGFRCARYPTPVPDSLFAPVVLQERTPVPQPISDAAFDLLRRSYSYDKTPLEAERVSVNDSLADYRWEVVSVKSAYSDERLLINLFTPRDIPPPWQSVIWFPGADVFVLRETPALSSAYLVDFLPRTGRALVYPVYDGMHQRFRSRTQSPSALREFLRHWSQDIGRTIDYLETRPDFDATRVAYYGFSGGANYGPIFSAVEPRLRAAILMGAGFNRAPWGPDTHPRLFAPRMQAATLLLNGRDDFILPYESAQRPLFEAIGVPDSLKRLARLNGGHIPDSRVEVIREVLAWLDRHLGPVTHSQPATGGGSR